MSYYYVYITPVPITIGNRITILADQPFYVGKGSGMRWKDHITPSRLRSKYQNWMKLAVIRHIKESGAELKIEISNDMSDTESLEQERRLISKYGRMCDGSGILTNLTLGGEGVSGFSPSQKTREIWSKQRKGKVPACKGTKRPGVGGRPKGKKWSETERAIHLAERTKSEYWESHRTEEYRKKMSDLKKGCHGSATDKFWYNNGVIETYAYEAPNGFSKGRLYKEQLGKRGLVWYNNGIVNRQFTENKQEDEFSRGRISKKR